MIIKNFKSLESYFLNFVLSEFKRLKENEFKGLLENLPYQIGVRFLSGIDQVWDSMFKYQSGHITRRYVVDEINKLSRSEYSSSMCASMISYINTETNRHYIKTIWLDVRTVAFNKSILDHLNDIESFKEWITLSLKHEIGHILDYKTLHDKDPSEADRYFEIKDKQYDEFYAWKEEHDGAEYMEERLRKYYEDIDIERTANQLGGITIEEIIEINKKMFSQNNEKINLEIRVIKEGENDNE